MAAWVYQWVCRLDLVHDSWTQPVQVRRLEVGERAVKVAAAQVHP